MIRRASLSLKILFLASLNVLLLALLFFVFARVQFRFSFGSFLLAPAKATIASVSRLIALHLPNTPRASWTALLAQYSSRYPAQFYLFNQDAEELAGPPVVLPHAFASAIRKDPFARERTDGPPRDEGPREPPRNFGRPRFDRPPPMRESFVGDTRVEAQDATLAFTRSTNPFYYWAGVRVPIWLGDRPEPIHATLVWRIPSLWTERLFFDYRPWLGIVLAILATLVVCWLPLVRDLTGAIRRLTAATGQIAAGHFEVKLPTNRHDELGHLSESIHSMAQRLSGYVYGQKRFLGDIAHELSSPIARIEVGLGILEQRITGPEVEYVVDVREDVNHVSSLVSELLTFSKSQVSQKTAEITTVALEPLVRQVIDREGARTAIVDDSVVHSAPVAAVPEALERALANVVRNAVRYAGAGPITVRADHVDGQISIVVADEGPGIPENELENVFRPFYRPEFARQSETGGTGLGLAIVRDCIESCQGSVTCRNRAPHGLEVVIRLKDSIPQFTNA